MMAGNYRPVVTRSAFFGDAEKGTDSHAFKFVFWPVVLLDDSSSSTGGLPLQRHWGMVQQICGFESPSFTHTWRMRDMLTVKFTPSCITVVSTKDGEVLWQNAASMAMFGEQCYILARSGARGVS